MSGISYISGLNGACGAHYLFNYIRACGQNIKVFAFIKDEEIDDFCDDIKTFSKYYDFRIPVLSFPYNDEAARNFCIDEIKSQEQFIVLCPDTATDIKTISPSQDNGFLIEAGGRCKFSDLIVLLADYGFTRTPFVEERLQFSVRGEIIDIWPSTENDPIRIVFDFDNIGSLRIFDPLDQLSKEYIDSVKIYQSKSRELDSTILDYIVYAAGPQKTAAFFDYAPPKEYVQLLQDAPQSAALDIIINDPLNPKSIRQNYQTFSGFVGDLKYFLDTLDGLIKSDLVINFFCFTDGERERLEDIIAEKKWPQGKYSFMLSNLSSSFYIAHTDTVFVSSQEMFYKRKPVKFPKIKGGKRLESIWEIGAGDFVVHERYGIGKYAGLKTLIRNNAKVEYLCIEYAKGDKLYVWPDAIKKVKKYVGVEGMRPKLYSMDSSLWESIKSKAKEEAARFAKELLELYAQRSLTKRPPYSYMNNLERELADSFIYQETPDQAKAIEDVNSDFARDFPMERLVCGDVGYGKTEVALRAAFKVVSGGKQAALLAPTTVLAQQHYNTFINRLGMFAVRVEVLSRFQSPQTQKKIIAGLAKGDVDIVIGTHRLLQKDVHFSNLGLLIIDEEHRFGVRQKEHIKDMKKNIDVLLLSATPIPRTLSSALSGFRDLSVIETPPQGRQSIETSLSVYDESMTKRIILAELSRGGQVFYVYNKVENMDEKLKDLKKLLPDVRIASLHGQMPTKAIEKVMWDFTHAQYDVLLASAIIESGLDIPSANTMIIENAQNFGLSQLYQLRGRIGRQKRKAYCYMFYDDNSLTEEGIKRLEAMQDFTALGSGFRLAMKDMEIRGAGGILSKSQHGFVRDIGYDLFSNLLKAESEKLKGIEIKEAPDMMCELALNFNSLLPENYINDEDARISFYRRLSEAGSNKDIEKIEEELIDRFGKIPDEARPLFEGAKLRLFARRLFLERISEDNDRFYFFFYKTANFTNARFEELMQLLKGNLEFISGDNYGFAIKRSYILSEQKSESDDTGCRVIYAVDEFLKKLKFYLGM